MCNWVITHLLTTQKVGCPLQVVAFGLNCLRKKHVIFLSFDFSGTITPQVVSTTSNRNLPGIIQLHKKLMFELKLRRSFRLSREVEKPTSGSLIPLGSRQFAGCIHGAGRRDRSSHWGSNDPSRPFCFCDENLQTLAGLNSDNLGETPKIGSRLQTFSA